ncbi:PREDICTED: 39S ribosomal protein L15, mitochondrial [Colobus angolensis palliatus]|uniref:39S ribosomal protein L15, mitochondrial n=1 Tax=Colobus angolensis palliatus TaxID=336983 RepID=UPI0005F44804|nr:PREDICTED: 39S ribosomal protein L15, mitochondrial [Colobus angolensis palliatus]
MAPAINSRWRDDQEVGEEVENVAEAIKEKGKEEPGPAWALREARLHFTSESQNTGLTKDIDCFDIFQGADTFTAKVNIEVQLASELAIAAIEKNGGVVTTAFYDPRSLDIVCKPVPFFLRGQPIPKRMLPPEELVPYYTDAKNRGYLADPAKFPEARLELARKYGYILPDITKDELFKMLCTRKDPRQIFFGLAPGWVVNMTDKKILKPTDENLLKYYSS